MHPLPDLEPEPDLLDRLVTLLDAEAREGGWHQTHRLVSLRSTPDGDIQVGTRDLAEGEHPLQYLLGFTAPDDWLAIGAITFGWASPWADGAEAGHAVLRPSHHPDRVRVRSVCLVARDGAAACTASLEDGRVVDSAPVGMVMDAFRRALGIETAPPPSGVGALLAGLWLEDVLALLADEPSPSWPTVAGVHPALAAARAGGARIPASRLVTLGRLIDDAVAWADVRLQAASGATPWGLDVDPDVAAWMDEGMFARWALGSARAPAVLLDLLDGRLSERVHTRVRACLQAWNVLANG